MFPTSARALRLAGVAGGLLTLLAGLSAAPSQKETNDVLKPLRAPGRGTLKGRVTLDGKPPDLKALNAKYRRYLDSSPEDSDCLNGPEETRQDPRWRIGKEGGVGNVFVSVSPPGGWYFELGPDDLDPKKAGWAKEVVMRVKHCTYEPHCVVLFPAYHDPRVPENWKPTGQKFRTTSEDRKTPHVTRIDDPDFPSGDLRPPGPDMELTNLRPTRLPIRVHCTIHPRMEAYAWPFAHPFAAVTDRDGNFEIRNVPAGVKLTAHAWHEATGWFTRDRRGGDPVEIPVGGTLEHSFKLRVKR